MKAVKVNEMFGEVVNIDEDGDVVAKFGGSYQLQISKVDNVWKVTNGVDGYGHNCRDEFKDAIVTPLYESTPAEDCEAVYLHVDYNTLRTLELTEDAIPRWEEDGSMEKGDRLYKATLIKTY